MRIYTCLFLIALVTLAYEISLSRLMSIVTWYHLGFFAISVAMLGMTSGAIAVLLNEDKFTDDRIIGSARKGCIAFALSIVVAMLFICYVTVPVDLSWDNFSKPFIRILAVTVFIALPFFFSGIVISALLTLSSKPVHRLYAADLIGAAAGCMSVAIVLSFTDTVTAVLLFAFLAVFSAVLLYQPSAKRNFSLLAIASATILFAIISTGSPLLALTAVKGRDANYMGWGKVPIEVQRWNSFSRVAVSAELTGPPFMWAADPEKSKGYESRQRSMNIDGAAGTAMREFSTLDDLEHLQFDVTNIAHEIREPGSAVIIGVGGAKDVQAALWYGHSSIKGIELNPVFIDLLNNEYREFAGVADHEAVELIVDEARSYLSHDKSYYDFIQMSLIDTWAATGAGAFSLSENGLYTLEAWTTFFDRTSERGIFTVSRWYNAENPGETARMLSLAVSTLLGQGVANPREHIALVANHHVATLVVSRPPLTDAEVAKLEQASERLGHTILITPKINIAGPLIDDIINAKSNEEIASISDAAELNVSTPTDQTPYFFNMLKLDNLGPALSHGFSGGVLVGNLRATITLLMLIGILVFLIIPTIVLPTWFFQRRTGKKMNFYWPSALFFMCIGSGFMALEIGLLQRLSVYLGHPIYALSVLLFGIILSTGIGSLVSEKLSHDSRKTTMGLGLLTVISILLLEMLVNQVIATTIVYSMAFKILCSVAILFPTGLLLGCFFPTGLSITKANGEANAAPWYWALNGIFGVLFSALAVLISIYIGISVNFYVAAVAYSGTVLCFYLMLAKREKALPV